MPSFNSPDTGLGIGLSGHRAIKIFLPHSLGIVTHNAGEAFGAEKSLWVCSQE
jgi:hypothetical protein